MAKKKKKRAKRKSVGRRRKDHDTVRGTKDEMVKLKGGAVRSTTVGKGRFDLLSFWAIRRIALHMENGLKKYKERNWEKGIPLSRQADAAMRHLFMFITGMDDEDHLAAAAWNLHGMLHTQEMIHMGKLPKELDDMPDYGDLDPMIKRLYPETPGAKTKKRTRTR